MRLGVQMRHSRPYRPQTQANLERFHQTFKRDVLHRAFSDLQRCQRGGAGGEKSPATTVRTSPEPAAVPRALSARPRSYAEQLLIPEDHLVKVRRTGQVYFKGLNIFVSGGLYGKGASSSPSPKMASTM